MEKSGHHYYLDRADHRNEHLDQIELFSGLSEQDVQNSFSAFPTGHLAFFYGATENRFWEPRLDGFMVVKEMAYSA